MRYVFLDGGSRDGEVHAVPDEAHSLTLYRGDLRRGQTEEYVDHGAMTNHRSYGVIEIWDFSRSWASVPRTSGRI
jgi:hypothetical protein